MYGCRHRGSCAHFSPTRSQIWRIAAVCSLRSARTTRLPLSTDRAGYSHYGTDRKCRSTGYDYQNGGSYFDSSHNASFVRDAAAFVSCARRGILNRRVATNNIHLSVRIFIVSENKQTNTPQCWKHASSLRASSFYKPDLRDLTSTGPHS